MIRVLVLAALALVPGSAASESPLLVFATSTSPWVSEHVFAYTPGGSLRSLGPGSSPALSPDGRRLAFVRGANELWVASSDGTGAQRVAAAQDVVPGSLTWSPDGTRVAYGVYGPQVVVADVATGATTAIDGALLPAWSPDGTQLAFTRSTGSVVLLRPDGSGTTTIAKADFVTGLAWSPDGSRLAITGAVGAHAYVWTVAGDGSGFHALAGPMPAATGPSWSPNGRLLAYVRGGQHSSLRVVDLRGGGRVLAAFPLHTHPDGSTAWSADGRRVAAHTGAAVLVAPLSGSARFEPLPTAAQVLSPSLAWLGRRLVLSGHASGTRNDLELALVRADGTGFHALTRDTVDESDPSWSPDGARIAFVRRGEIETIRADGSGVRRLGRGTAAPTYSPDGRRIAFVDGRWIALMDADGGHRRNLARTTWPPRQLSWTPNGKTLVYADKGVVRRLDVATGAIADVDVGGLLVFRPVLSPDGGRIAFLSYRDERYFRDPAAWGVFVASETGGPATKISTGKLGPVSWSPDGKLLALTDGRRLEVIGADGPGSTTIADGARNEYAAFRPGS